MNTIDTLKILSTIQMIQNRIKNKYQAFSMTATQEEANTRLIYDDERPKEHAPNSNLTTYPIVTSCLIDDEHHDILSTCVNLLPEGCEAYAVCQKDDPIDDWWCTIQIPDGTCYITIEEDTWYLV